MKVTVTTTAAAFDPTAQRPYVAYNNGTVDVWFDRTSDPVGQGAPIKPGGNVVLGGDVDYYFATSTGTADLRCVEVARG